MTKLTTLALLMLAAGSFAHGQEVQEVSNPSGGIMILNDSSSMSYTIGSLYDNWTIIESDLAKSALVLGDPDDREQGFQVYPTMTRNQVTVEISGEFTTWNEFMTIYNTTGSINRKVELTGEKFTIDISEYPEGSYFFLLTNRSDNSKKTRTVLKIK